MALEPYVALRRALRSGTWAAWCAGAALGVTAACAASPFACTDQDECRDGSRVGVCEPAGFCSFPDLACDSGRRYGEHADDALAGECVPPAGASGTDSGSSGTASTGMSASSASVTGASDSDSANTTETGDTIDPTAGGADPYGPCETSLDCVWDGAVCVTNGNDRMCAPPCTSAESPSSECPRSADGRDHVGCLYTDAEMTTVRCFALCDDQTPCPTGMTCVEPVCTWSD